MIAAALYLATRVVDHRAMSDYGFDFSRKFTGRSCRAEAGYGGQHPRVEFGPTFPIP
jgi:hypothetical protein